MHGWPVPAGRVSGTFVWLDGEGRCHAAPAVDAPVRWRYSVFGDVLRFDGHGARRCVGCGAELNADADDPARPVPRCPLCGART